MKKILSLFLPISLVLMGLWLVSCGNRSASTLPQVMISKIVAHPALDATVQGIIDELAAAGYKNGTTITITEQSAQASAALAGQIASNFANAEPAVVVGVGTVAAQACAPYCAADKIKLVFSSVTDPEGAELVQSLQSPGNNTSGVSNFVPLQPQLDMFKRILPNMKKLGLIYNPGELNSVSIMRKLQQLCPASDLQLIAQAAPKTSDVAQAATYLAQQADALFISNDNTALSALQTIINIANTANIPVFVSDTDAVNVGALAALGPNQYEVGRQTGAMVARVLKGENPGTLPVEFPAKTELTLNAIAAQKLSIQLPADLLAQANVVIQEEPS